MPDAMDIAGQHFLRGDLPAALEAFECRWERQPKLAPWDTGVPEWKGEDLAGKRLLVHTEQGYGDSIMTARFIPDLIALGAEVTVCTHDNLAQLFALQDHWDCDVLAMERLDVAGAKHQFDYHSPSLSTLRWLGVTRDQLSGEPYLTAPDEPAPWREGHRLHVGVCWASGGRQDHSAWYRRTTAATDWAPLFEIPDVKLWSLCPQSAMFPETEMLGLQPPAFKNFAETAAFINNLDLVISVDTAVAHLAGALGRLTWMTIPYHMEWRWWRASEGTGLPWYKTMQVIPQPSVGDWATPIRTYAHQLAAIAAAPYRKV